MAKSGLEFRYFSVDGKPIKIPVNAEGMSDLNYAYGNPDVFQPISEFDYEVERERKDIRDNPTISAIKAFGKGVASDQAFALTEFVEAGLDSPRYLAELQELGGARMAGELTSGVGTAALAFFANPVLGAGVAAKEGGEFVARQAVKKSFLRDNLQRFADAKVGKSTVGEIAQSLPTNWTSSVGTLVDKGVTKVLSEEVKGQGLRNIARMITKSTLPVATEAGVDSAIRNMVQAGVQEYHLNPDKTTDSVIAAMGSGAVSGFKEGFEFGGYLGGGIGTATQVFRGASAARQKFRESRVGKLPSQALARIGVADEAIRPAVAEELYNQGGDGLTAAQNKAEIDTAVDAIDQKLAEIAGEERVLRAERAVATAGKRVAAREAEQAKAARRASVTTARTLTPDEVARLEGLDTAIKEAEDNLANVRANGDADAVAEQERIVGELTKEKANLERSSGDLKTQRQNRAQSLQSKQAELRGFRSELAAVRRAQTQDVAAEKKSLQQKVAKTQAALETANAARRDVIDSGDKGKEAAGLLADQQIEELRETLANDKAVLAALEEAAAGVSPKEYIARKTEQKMAEIEQLAKDPARQAELDEKVEELVAIRDSLKRESDAEALRIQQTITSSSEFLASAAVAQKQGRNDLKEAINQFTKKATTSLKNSLVALTGKFRIGDEGYSEIFEGSTPNFINGKFQFRTLAGDKRDLSAASRAMITAVKKENIDPKKAALYVSKQLDDLILSIRNLGDPNSADILKQLERFQESVGNIRSAEDLFAGISAIRSAKSAFGQLYSKAFTAKTGTTGITKNEYADIYDRFNNDVLNNEQIFGGAAYIQRALDKINQMYVDPTFLKGLDGANKLPEVHQRGVAVKEQLEEVIAELESYSNTSGIFASKPNDATLGNEIKEFTLEAARYIEEALGPINKELTFIGDEVMAAMDASSALNMNPRALLTIETLEDVARRQPDALGEMVGQYAALLRAVRRAEIESGVAKGEKAVQAQSSSELNKEASQAVKDAVTLSNDSVKAVNQAVEALRKASKAEAAEEAADLFGETEELVSQLRELVDTGTANVAAMSKGRKAAISDISQTTKTAVGTIDKARQALVAAIRGDRISSAAAIDKIVQGNQKKITELEGNIQTTQSSIEQIKADPQNAKIIKDLEEDVIRKRARVAELKKELADNKELQRQIKDDAQAGVGKARKDKQAAKKKIKDDVIKRVEVAMQSQADEITAATKKVAEDQAEIARIDKDLLEKSEQRLKKLRERQIAAGKTPSDKPFADLYKTRQVLGSSPFTSSNPLVIGLLLAQQYKLATAIHAASVFRSAPGNILRLNGFYNRSVKGVQRGIEDINKRLMSNVQGKDGSRGQYVLGRSPIAQAIGIISERDMPTAGEVLKEAQAAEIERRVQALQSTENRTAVLDRVADEAPSSELSDAYRTRALAAINLIESALPQRPPKGPFDKTPDSYTPEQLERLSGAVAMIKDPLTRLNYLISNNLLTSEDVAQASAFVPDVTAQVIDSMMETLSDYDGVIPFDVQSMFGLALGRGLVASMSPEEVAGFQANISQPLAGQEQPSEVKFRQGAGKVLADAHMTQTDSLLTV